MKYPEFVNSAMEATGIRNPDKIREAIRAVKGLPEYQTSLRKDNDGKKRYKTFTTKLLQLDYTAEELKLVKKIVGGGKG